MNSNGLFPSTEQQKSPSQKRSEAQRRRWEKLKREDPEEYARLNEAKMRGWNEKREQIIEAKRGRRHSTEARQKISEGRKRFLANPENLQPVLSHLHTPEVAEKISQSLKERYADPDNVHHSTGTHHTPETRQKISESNKLHWSSEETRLARTGWHLSSEARQKIGEGQERFWDRLQKEDPGEYEERGKRIAEPLVKYNAAQKQKLSEAERLRNVEGLDLKTGLRISLAGHRALEGKGQYQMADDVYPDSADPFNAIKQLFRRFQPVIEDEKQRIAKLPQDQREPEATDLEVRLRHERSKPLKKSR